MRNKKSTLEKVRNALIFAGCFGVFAFYQILMLTYIFC